MKTVLDCIPCTIRQALDAARMVSADPEFHEQILRDVLNWTAQMDLSHSAPVMAQRIHRRLRELTIDDPYRAIKDRMNAIALELIPTLKEKVDSAGDPLIMAVRLAIAGNIIDLGVNGNLTEDHVYEAVKNALIEPFVGDTERFREAVAHAQSILYLADNAGEIAFDRLLIEQLSPQRVVAAVRGAPVINDATLADARAVGLDKIVEVIVNGSDAPATIVTDCSRDFRRRFAEADLIIAKGQGNYESLSDEPGNIFFLFKVKCPVIADHVHQPIGTQILMHIQQ